MTCSSDSGFLRPFASVIYGAGLSWIRPLVYGVGAQILACFTGGHALLPRIDYTDFEKTSPTKPVRIAYLGVDYNYFLSRRAKQSGYVVGAGQGLGLAKFGFESPVKHGNDSPTSP